MNEQAWLVLLERVENGTATDDELVLYNTWCNSFQRQQIPVQDFDKVQAAMLREINARTGHRPMRKILYRTAAAAAVLLLLAAGGMYFYRQPAATVLVQGTGGADSVTKTVLTLADGSTITLGDEQEGEVATQSGTKIIKQQNNQLTYRSESEGKGMPLAYNTLQTPRGEKYRITLPDGSVVWLNAASRLRFPASFTGSERIVELTGEAYFEVAGSAEKPFKVKTGEMEVQVLGTAFNVMAYPDEPAIKSTLVQGAVRLFATDAQVILRPGQQGTFNNDFNVKQVNVADVTAWKNGYFVFNDEEISVIMRRIARWYDVDIVMTSGVANKKFGITISQQKDIASVLKALEMTGSVHFKKEGRKITVTQ